MKLLFAHQNFPGQYQHLVRHLAADPGNEIVFVTQRKDARIPGVKKIVYRPRRETTPGIHPYLRDLEASVLNAQVVATIATDLRTQGFRPDAMIGHNGWGEIWYLKEIYPDVPLIGYFELFYRLSGANLGFDPADPVGPDTGPLVRTRNAGNHIGLDVADLGQCPTPWQWSSYPEAARAKLRVVHDGIDCAVAMPAPGAALKLPGTDLQIRNGDEIVTFCARNLERYRGIDTFMHALPEILAARPQARAIVIGGDEHSYGPRPADGRPDRIRLLAELGDSLDRSRVHFLGRVPYEVYLRVLQTSKVHVYLSYPFVLSWSLLEAMAARCLVVASRTAPVEEAIQDGINGRLIDFFSPAELAQRCIEVLADRGDFDPIRKAARASVIERWDFRTRCLPAQLRLIAEARERMA